MTEVRFEHTRELDREYVRRASRLLGLAAPDFGDADEAFEWGEADRQPLPVNDPTSIDVFSRQGGHVTNETRRGMGLPEGA
jgi:hypothetical protein